MGRRHLGDPAYSQAVDMLAINQALATSNYALECHAGLCTASSPLAEARSAASAEQQGYAQGTFRTDAAAGLQGVAVCCRCG